MKLYQTIVLLLLAMVTFVSCDLIGTQHIISNSPDPGELINAEKSFSQMSYERGMKKAFIHYIAREGILLRPDEDPVVGADAIEYLSQINDSAYKITWQTRNAEISGDGNMGFTYGIYKMEVEENIIMGTYVNIWKKQNGEWRFVLNSGNQGITE